ncbi:MAG: hypothetical protein II997_09110 [Clostridia bacterium]|nr:hypothetical protein [Clostridia bacterium]
MKHCRRLIALLLILMLVPVYGVAAAKETSPQQLIGIKFLTEIGILDEDFVNLDPEGKVSRAEYAEILVKLADADTLAYGYYDTDYSYDVSSDYYEAGYINAAIILGLMENEEGIFAPTNELTYVEAVKAMVKLLGYNATIKGDSDAVFMEAAQRAKILTGITKNDDGTISRGTMYRLIDNALEANVIVEAGVGDKGRVVYEKGGTLLAEYHDIYMTDGIVSATKYGELSYDNVTVGNTINIDRVGYSIKGGKGTEYLGYRVRAYYKEASPDREILFMAPFKNEILTITSDNIIGYSKRTYTYLDEDGDTETVSTSGAVVLYNGVSAEGVSFVAVPAQGEVNFVDNNNDGKYDIVSILNYVDYVVAAVDAENDKIYPKFDTALNFSRYDSVDLYDSASGEKIKLSEIAAGEIITVLRDATSKKAIIYRSTKTETGMVKGIEKDNKTYLTVGETKYEYAKVFNDYVANTKITPCEVGGNYTFKLNHFGKIAWAETYSNYMSNFSFGIAIAEKVEKALGNDVTLKLYTQLGLVEYFDIADNCVIDGIKCKNPKDALKHFYKDGEGIVPASGTFIPQPLRFKTNDKAEITNIDLVGPKREGEIGLYLAYDGTTTKLLYNPAFQAFGVGSSTTPQYALGKSVLMKAPYNDQGILDASASHELYGSYTLPSSGNTSVLGKAYKTDPNTMAFEFIVKKISTVNGIEKVEIPEETQIHLFLEQVVGLNLEGEPTTMVRYSDAGTVLTKALDPGVDLTRVSVSNDDVTTHSLDKGDIFRFATNSKGEISKIQAVYDYSTDTFLGTNEDGDINKMWHPNESMYATRLNVYQYDGSYIKTTNVPCESWANDEDMFLVLLSRNSVFKKAIVYDSVKNEVAPATAYQIRDYLTCGGDYTKGIIWRRYGDPRRMVIYK